MGQGVIRRGAVGAAAQILGTIRDAVRGVQVGYVGPYLTLEKTVAIPANTTLQFSLAVTATMGIDWFEFVPAAPGLFMTSMSIGAVEYFSKRDTALAPNPPVGGLLPMNNRGLLRRIETIQGDAIIVTCNNTTAGALNATLWVSGYRLGEGTCID